MTFGFFETLVNENFEILFTKRLHLYPFENLSVKVWQPIEKWLVYPFLNSCKSFTTNGKMTCVHLLLFMCGLHKKQLFCQVVTQCTQNSKDTNTHMTILLWLNYEWRHHYCD